jgi:hypothetical protein
VKDISGKVKGNWKERRNNDLSSQCLQFKEAHETLNIALECPHGGMVEVSTKLFQGLSNAW